MLFRTIMIAAAPILALAAGLPALATTYTFTGMPETGVIETTGLYRVTLAGGSGGGSTDLVSSTGSNGETTFELVDVPGGVGGFVQADVYLTAGARYTAIVAGDGEFGSNGGGGGGASLFVIQLGSPGNRYTLIAGGGGGSYFGAPGGIGGRDTAARDLENNVGYFGGNTINNSGAGGGGSYNYDGADGDDGSGGQALSFGAAGGIASRNISSVTGLPIIDPATGLPQVTSNGGFGGGGAGDFGGGGGGGFEGGNAGYIPGVDLEGRIFAFNGAGGTSFISGSSAENARIIAGGATNGAFVSVVLLPDTPTPVPLPAGILLVLSAFSSLVIVRRYGANG